ncbi:MAG: preprotein translocase subunit SecE [Proteobacteria bacterium]|nr:preprotein translocase subunit SecE [Pseudomonadota bacterium]MBU1640172.1 preprotein translocase subunit SecE [Pseudomonadota bacterium]
MAKNPKALQTGSEQEEKKFSLSKISEFTADVKKEFGKIAWPPKNNTIRMTGVVIVLVFLISFYLGAVDMLLGKLINFILK